MSAVGTPVGTADEALVAAVQTGDQAAFAALVERHQRVEGGKLVELTCFSSQPLGPRFFDDEVPDLLPAFGLPSTLDLKPTSSGSVSGTR